MERFIALAKKRVLILDGAMGTMAQSFSLTEEDYRGTLFAGHPEKLKGCNDVLCLTRPDVIENIHRQYLEAGADIIGTCSFSANAIALAAHKLAGKAREISYAAAAIARRCADAYSTADSPRFVAGVLGPATKSASIPKDAANMASRAVYWDDLYAAYYDNAGGLLDGGADILLIETIFDTLNAKAAIAACVDALEERGITGGSGRGHEGGGGGGHEGGGGGAAGPLPIMLSATVSDKSGRLLCGQTVEAFCVSVSHARPLAVGLNCSLGAAALEPLVRKAAETASCLISAHPNAGLPNEAGDYDQSPAEMAAQIKPYLDGGLVNIIGGCCGTTPAHIKAIAAAAAGAAAGAGAGAGTGAGAAAPRTLPDRPPVLRLAGLDALTVGGGRRAADGAGCPPAVPPAPPKFFICGEGGNAPGSRRFMEALKNGDYDRCIRLMRENVKAGVDMMDICADDGMLDVPSELRLLALTAGAEPALSRVPFVLDSSDWEALEAALKCVTGKPLVNSITLKDGEASFLRRARRIRRYGAAAVVMLFDEQGQADTRERKVAVAARAFGLLSSINFPPEDIVFDLNVLSVATGIPAHDRYALDFIQAIRPVLALHPAVNISAGVSNLSYSFRGNAAIRRAMHAVFLHHCQEQGMRLAICAPGALSSYDTLDPEFRLLVEDILLARGNPEETVKKLLASQPAAGDRLLSAAGDRLSAAGDRLSAAGNGQPANSGSQAAAGSGSQAADSGSQAAASGGARLTALLISGDEEGIEEAVREALAAQSPLDIVEGPLMDGMREVGSRFENGQMFLPQVLRSARVMQAAVAALDLQPGAAAAVAGSGSQAAAGAAVGGAAAAAVGGAGGGGTAAGAGRPKMVLATVRGDVHDIGKNIVGIVLGCAGFDVIDLGVMTPCEKILEAARAADVRLIGLSGLVTPSLNEMITVARALEAGGFSVPLLVGGAAASLVHTALKITPEYSAPVVYVRDASRAAAIARELLSDRLRAPFLASLNAEYTAARDQHRKLEERRKTLTLEEARANKPRFDWR